MLRSSQMGDKMNESKKQTITLTRWMKSGENGTVKLKLGVTLSEKMGKLTSTTKIKVKDVKNGLYNDHIINHIVNNFSANGLGAVNVYNSHGDAFRDIQNWINSDNTPTNLFIKFENSDSKVVTKAKKTKSVKKSKKINTKVKKVKKVRVKKEKVVKPLTNEQEFRVLKKKIFKKYELFKKMNGINRKDIREMTEDVNVKYKKIMGMWKELLVFVMDKNNIPYEEIQGTTFEYIFRLVDNHGNIDVNNMRHSYYNVPIKLRMKTKLIVDPHRSWRSMQTVDPDSVSISNNNNRNGGKQIKSLTYNKLTTFLQDNHKIHQKEYDIQLVDIQKRESVADINEKLFKDVDVVIADLKKKYRSFDLDSGLIKLGVKLDSTSYWGEFANFLYIEPYNANDLTPVVFKTTFFGVNSILYFKDAEELKVGLENIFYPQIIQYKNTIDKLIEGQNTFTRGRK